MPKNIMDAPHGMNLVIHCNDGAKYIGRFDQCNGFEVLMHDCDVWDPAKPASDDVDHWIRETATYGVDVKHRDLRFDAHRVESWQALGSIEKLR
ncbi:MAG: hypothetical protein R3F17_08800 [Planctomycetota bacterium]